MTPYAMAATGQGSDSMARRLTVAASSHDCSRLDWLRTPHQLCQRWCSHSMLSPRIPEEEDHQQQHHHLQHTRLLDVWTIQLAVRSVVWYAPSSTLVTLVSKLLCPSCHSLSLHHFDLHHAQGKRLTHLEPCSACIKLTWPQNAPCHRRR